MDIATRVDYDATIEYQLLDPETYEPTGVEFTLMSSNNSKSKTIMKRQLNAINRNGGNKLPVETIEKQVLERLAACVAGWSWSGDTNFNGEKPEFNEANVIKVLSIDWIYDQINKEVQGIENFTKA